MAASCLNRPDAWLWGGIHILLTAALPTLYIVYLYRQGRVSDPHLNVRSERFRPLVAAVLTSFLFLWLLYSASAPRLLVLLAALNLIQLVLFLGITLRWKISAHCTAVASLAVLGFYLLGLIIRADFLLVVSGRTGDGNGADLSGVPHAGSDYGRDRSMR